MARKTKRKKIIKDTGNCYSCWHKSYNMDYCCLRHDFIDDETIKTGCPDYEYIVKKEEECLWTKK